MDSYAAKQEITTRLGLALSAARRFGLELVGAVDFLCDHTENTDASIVFQGVRVTVSLEADTASTLRVRVAFAEPACKLPPAAEQVIKANLPVVGEINHFGNKGFALVLQVS